MHSVKYSWLEQRSYWQAGSSVRGVVLENGSNPLTPTVAIMMGIVLAVVGREILAMWWICPSRSSDCRPSSGWWNETLCQEQLPEYLQSCSCAQQRPRINSDNYKYSNSWHSWLLYAVSQEMQRLWNGRPIARNDMDQFWWHLAEIFKRLD